MPIPFNAVMIIPTGIGATIGGHAGDATIYARLLAGVCDRLILHPNVVNAADLNEMPENSLYVEGSMLDRFLRGEIFLLPVACNQILVVCNEVIPATSNCVAAAQMLLGVAIRLEVLGERLVMRSEINNGTAGGHVSGVEALCRQVQLIGAVDAVAIHTVIEVDRIAADHYLRTLSGVNPWGGVEAIVSRQVSGALGLPCAHAPIETNPEFDECVPAEIAAELISGSMLFSVLKGLHKAPRIASDQSARTISVDDIDVLISPDCWGPPHESCREANIPIIIVKDNKTNQPALPAEIGYAPNLIFVRTYLEAAGAVAGLRQGTSLAIINNQLPFLPCGKPA